MLCLSVVECSWSVVGKDRGDEGSNQSDSAREQDGLLIENGY